MTDAHPTTTASALAVVVDLAIADGHRRAASATTTPVSAVADQEPPAATATAARPDSGTTVVAAVGRATATQSSPLALVAIR